MLPLEFRCNFKDRFPKCLKESPLGNRRSPVFSGLAHGGLTNGLDYLRRPPRLGISPPITRQARAPRILESPLHLPLIAHLPQPIALPWRQTQIHLHTNKMYSDRQPQGHSKAHAQARTNLFRSLEVKLSVHDDEIVNCRVGSAALGVKVLHWNAGAINEGDLVAGHGGVVRIKGCDAERGDDQDQTERDDGAEVEHRPQHPGAMLVDLEALDVVVCEADADCCYDHKQADSCLSFDCPTEGPSADHEGTDVGNKNEEDDNVAVDAVEDKQFLSNDGDELPNHEEAGWQDGAEVDGNADSIDAGIEPVPLAR